RRARYGRWSLRSLADPVIRRYFTQRGAHYFLRPDIRAMVDFGYLNLADGDYPGSAFDIRDMDLVLCRNVLIYLDRATVAEVAKRMLASLSEDGWLFLGASDPPLVDLVPCEVVVTGAGLAYRRPRVDSAPGRRRPAFDEPVSALATVVAQGLYTTIREGAAADSGQVPDAAQEVHAPGLELPDDSPDFPAGAVADPHPPLPDAPVRTEPADSAAGAVSPDSAAS